jgi:hypothetical protein
MGALCGLFPSIAPIKILNTVYSFLSKVITARGDWKDKTDFFLAKFEDMAIADLKAVDSNAFAFSGLEILDANLSTLTRGNAHNLPQGSIKR